MDPIIEQALKPFAPTNALKPAYCDYIAHEIKAGLWADPERLLSFVDNVRWDLHPVGGYMLSTKKTIEIMDRNGTHYRVTVEEVAP